MAKINNEFILPKQADSQLSENVYFIDIQPVGYLLSVNEVQLSLGGAAATRRHFEIVYLTPSAESTSSTSNDK